MKAKPAVLSGEVYHVYNRGTEKRKIFMNDADRIRFIHDMWEFNDVEQVDTNAFRAMSLPSRKRTNAEVQPTYFDDKKSGSNRQKLVHVHAYCLMDNHYHLMLSPAVPDGIALFMKKLGGGYTMYFNEKYSRTGALFQGRYKRKLIKSDGQYLHLPIYIHLNPLDAKCPEWRTSGVAKSARTAALKYLESYRWSSHLDYMGFKNFASVVHMDTLKRVFTLQGGYAKVVQEALAYFDTNVVKPVQIEKDV